MKTINLIKGLSNYQIEVSFIILGVYFNKNEKVNIPSKDFKDLAQEGIKALKEIDVEFSNEFNISQLKDLLKIEMMKRGIEMI